MSSLPRQTPDPAHASRVARALRHLGAAWRPTLAYPARLGEFVGHFCRALTERPFETQAILLECKKVGMYSLPLAVAALFFVGLVFAFQFGFTLRTMGAVPYIPKVTSMSMVRELGPAFTALVVGGRVGAGMASELGSMRVTEQIDAIRALGANPYKKLLLPRVIAATFMFPLLCVFAILVGELGALFISWFEFRLRPLFFYHSAIQVLGVGDLLSGLLKPFFFGFAAAVIGCYQGFHCKLGTAGVGAATTRAVVHISLAVLMLDFVLTRLFAMFLLSH